MQFEIIKANLTLLTERKMKLREAAARRKEVNRDEKETRFVNGATVPRASERGAEAIAEVRTYQELRRVV